VKLLGFQYSLSGTTSEWARDPAPMDITRILVGCVLLVTGTGLAGVALLDIYEDVIIGDKSLILNIAENLLPLFFHVSIIAVGVWLLTSDVERHHVERVGQWFLLALVSVSILGFWVYLFQILQDSIKPLFVFAHLLGAAGAAGIAIGMYDAQQTSREQELEQYEAIVGSIQDQVYVLDSNGRFVFVNEPFARFVGRTVEELLGADVDTVFGDATTVRTEAASIANEKKETAQLDVSVTTSEGSIPCETTLSYMPGAVGGAVGVVRDVSHREAVEAELESERSRLSILYQSVPDPIAETELRDSPELQTEVLSVNDEFERQFNTSTESAQGNEIGTVVHDAAGEPIRPTTTEPHESEISCRTADGIRTFLLRTVPFDIDGRREAYWLFTDITDQTMRQRRLKVLNRVMRHNLRNDMTVLINYAEVLATHEDDDVAETASNVVDTAKDIVSMGNRLKRIDEMIEGKGTRQARPVTDIVDAALEEAAINGNDVGVDITDEYAVTADNTLEEAIAELVTNAFEHNDREKPAVSIAVDTYDEQWVEISVVDDGPGLPEQERIPFEDGDVTQLNHASGLGLWMVSWTVSSLGGELSVEENLPRGTTINIRLPQP